MSTVKKPDNWILLTLVLALLWLGCGPAGFLSQPSTPPPNDFPILTPAPADTAIPQARSTNNTLIPTAAAVGGPLWADMRLKQAIAAAIDRQTIIDQVFQGRVTPAYSMIPPGYPGATEPFRAKYGTRNLDLAQKLLTDMGFSKDKPFTFDLFYQPDNTGSTTADVMRVIKQQLEETGMIKVNLQTQTLEQFNNGSNQSKFPAFINGWIPDFADSENSLTPFGSCSQSPGQGVNYCDKKLDDLLSQGRSESDHAKRNAIYKQIGDYWAENVPTLPLWWEPEYITVRKGVNGVKIGATLEFNYNLVSFDPSYKPASGKTDTLIIGTTDWLDSLDPQDAYTTLDLEILKNTGIPLLEYKPGTLELLPGAAVNMPRVSDGGKTYSYTLRDNIKFPDGTAVTASDYVRLFKRLSLKGDVASLLTNYIDDVSAPDVKTVVIKLNNAYAFFPALSATAPFIPTNPKLFPDNKIIKFPASLDGIGPYRMVSYKESQQLVLAANPNYFGNYKPLIKNVIVKYFDKPSAMGQAVEEGKIDIAWRLLGADEAARLQKVDSVSVTKIDASTLNFLVFDMKWTPGK